MVRPPWLLLALAWFAVLAAAGAALPGLANQLTLARVHLAAPALAYSLLPQGLLPLASVVAVAGLTDVLDGAVARRWERPTALGGALDPVADGVLFGAVAVGLAAAGAYPPWLAGVVVLRYLLPALAGGALLLAQRQLQLQHTPAGQASTTVNAALLGAVALLRGLGAPTGQAVWVAEVLIPAAALATFANLGWTNRLALTRKVHRGRRR